MSMESFFEVPHKKKPELAEEIKEEGVETNAKPEAKEELLPEEASKVESVEKNIEENAETEEKPSALDLIQEKIDEATEAIENYIGYAEIREQFDLETTKKRLNQLAEILNSDSTLKNSASVVSDNHLKHVIGNFVGGLGVMKRVVSGRAQEALKDSYRREVNQVNAYLEKAIEDKDFRKEALYSGLKDSSRI